MQRRVSNAHRVQVVICGAALALFLAWQTWAIFGWGRNELTTLDRLRDIRWE